MSVSAWVSHTEQVLARARSLFADPATSGGTYADQSSTLLHTAAHQTQTTAEQRTVDAGQMAGRYQGFASAAIPQSQAVANDDATLRTLLDHAAATDRHGLRASTTILNATSTDVAAFAPCADTPTGERALLTALRDRVAEQQQGLHDTGLRVAELTAPLRFLYQPTGLVVDEPPPEQEPPPGGTLCYIGTKDGDPAQICAGYDVS